MIVAWHKVPGSPPSQKSRPVGYGMIRAGVRADSKIGGGISNAVSVPRNTAHISMKNPYRISCARSYRTLRDGSFGGSFPRHFVPGYDRTCPSGTKTIRSSKGLALS